MGPTALVSKDQVRAGKDFLVRLTRTDLAPSGAAWVKTEDDGQPYLYIVSPYVDQRGSIQGSQLLVKELREFQAERQDDPFDQLDSFSIKLVGPSESVGRGVGDHYKRWPDSTPTWHGGSVLGPVSIDGAYIYPAKMFAPAQAQPAT